MQNSVECFNRRLDIIKEKINELKDRLAENSWNEAQ